MKIEAILARALPGTGYCARPEVLWSYSRDLSTGHHIRARAGRAFDLPAAVAWPASISELQQLVRLARQEGLDLMPFGAGSGVVQGLHPHQRSVVVDLKRFDGIALDQVNARCRCGAGVIGEQLERWLNLRGFSLGHFPSSIYCSTVGGWVATRSAGQLSSRYGKIEDLVLWLRGVDGHGRECLLRRGDPGVDGLGLAMGSEGTLLVITEVGLAVHPVPTHRALRGAALPSLPVALDALKRLMGSGLPVAMLRLYDPLDTLLSGHAARGPVEQLPEIEAGAIGCVEQERIRARDPARAPRGRVASTLDPTRVVQDLQRRARRHLAKMGLAAWPRLDAALRQRWRRCHLVYGFEGSQGEVRAALAAARSLLERAGGRDLGPGPGRHWLERRYAVSYKLSPIFDAGLWADTFEVAAPWEHLQAVHTAVTGALQGQVLCLAHFSHAYPDGCSIYFSFVGWGADADEALASHAGAWRSALAAAAGAGAVLSHHHGIGRLKAEALRRVEGPEIWAVRRALKQALDPSGCLNRGALEPSGSEPAPSLTDAPEPEDAVGVVALRPTQRLAVVALRLRRQGLELGGAAAAFGRDRVADALRAADPRVVSRLAALEATVGGHRIKTRLAPRSATGPDLRALFVGQGLAHSSLHRVWLSLRAAPQTSWSGFEGALAALLHVARCCVDWGALQVELQLSATGARLLVEHRRDGGGEALWQARWEDQAAALQPLTPEVVAEWAREAWRIRRVGAACVAYPEDEFGLLETLAAHAGASGATVRYMPAAWRGAAIWAEGGGASQAQALAAAIARSAATVPALADAAACGGFDDLLEAALAASAAEDGA